jgi:hypothetical protein
MRRHELRTYYTWNSSHAEYEVVAQPAGIEAADTTQPPASDAIFDYPKNGQSIRAAVT